MDLRHPSPGSVHQCSVERITARRSNLTAELYKAVFRGSNPGLDLPETVFRLTNLGLEKQRESAAAGLFFN